MRDIDRRLLLGVALGHLVLAALGAGSVSLRPLGPIGRLLEQYSALTGADGGYGFFTPGVGGQLKAEFDVIDGQGHKSVTSLETGASHEADIRVGDIIDQFWSNADDNEDDVRRALSASLAGKIFGRHPDAREVVVRLLYFEPVSMEEFRGGSRPTWSPLYEARFTRDDRGASE